MQTVKFSQFMTDGTEIAVNRWIPDDEEKIKAVIVLSHGMLEHALRYDKIGSIFAENGYVFNAHDHRGHGKTAVIAKEKGTGEYAFLAEKDGFSKVVSDLSEVIAKAKKDFPGKKVILLGHSFGSFVSQCYIENQKDVIDGCVLSGTSGPQMLTAKMGRFAANLYMLFHKKTTRSKFMNNIAFGSYCKKIPNPRTSVDWLSSDPEAVDMYVNDSWCGGIPTVSFFKDLSTGLITIHNKKAMKRIDTNLPVFFFAGTEDPVGNYNKSIKALIEIYKKNGMKDVQSKFYEGDRHEPFNEKNYEEVIKDIENWIEKSVLK